MSWYPIDTVKCPKCGYVSSTPIDNHQHRLDCRNERIIFENGSVEFKSHGNILFIKAPNPFGGMWIMNYKSGIHNQSTGNPSEEGIWRRGKKWFLRRTEKGFIFQ